MPTLTPAQKADVEAADQQIADEELPDGDTPQSDDEPGQVSDDDEIEQEDDLSEQELAEARNLYKALKDPGTRSLVLNDLAKAAGITPDSTKKEIKEAKKGIEQILKETLGEGYNFMIPTLSKALEQILESEREERTASTQRVEAQVVQQQVDRALDRLARETKGDSRKVEARMVQLMNQFQASPDTDVYTYLQGIYNIATAGRSTKVATQKITEKINKNSKDAFARLPSARGTQLPNGKVPDKKMSLNQSIKWAMDQMEKG
jgi:hypothetical protein